MDKVETEKSKGNKTSWDREREIKGNATEYNIHRVYFQHNLTKAITFVPIRNIANLWAQICLNVYHL